jgi:undecaprenyl diphosphate synthase
VTSTANGERPPPGLPVPRSVAIIMDGNGRWATSRGLQRIKGHESASTAVRETVEECARLGVEALTLYAFSEENWRRPRHEADMLMKLLERFLLQQQGEMMANGIRLVHAGRLARLPRGARRTLEETVQMTAANRGMTLCLAISYGGRAELVDAMRALAAKVRAGELAPDDIDEALVAAHLYRPELPDPDLLIRTAGELRVSNFLLWQISYAELYVTDTLWPDFRKQDLWAAFGEYGRRVRKFGVVVP